MEKKMKSIKIDYKKFIEHYFMVIDREEQVPVPFILNKVQKKYLEMLQQGYPDQEGIREIILKARQQGFSSFILALFTADFIMRPYSVSICISHRRDSTELLFKKVRFYLESYLQKKAEEEKKIYTEETLKSWLASDNKGMITNSTNDATFYIGTAGAKVGGRGGSARNVHFCVGENTLVLYPDGSSKTIKNVGVGDRIISKNGEITTVTNKWCTGIKPIKQIRLWMGNETIDVSPVHKVMTVSGWKMAQDLTSQDWVEWSYRKSSESQKTIYIKRQKNCIHLSDDVNGLNFPLDRKLGYFIGYYLAEGHISKNLNRISFTCHRDEEYYRQFTDLFSINPIVQIRSDKTGTRKVITYNSKEIAMFVNNLVGRVKEKHVSQEIINDFPKDFILGMYSGWKDGDGSKGRKDACYITTIREKIARPMRQIGIAYLDKVLSLDFYVDKYRYSVKSQPSYILREHLNGDNIGKRSLKYKFIDGKCFIRVRSIKNRAPQPTYEIEVSNNSHSYLTPCGLISNSEAAFYQDTEMLKAHEMILATAQQVPQGRGMIFIESTANGEGNYYHAEWERASEGRSVYKPRFFGWQEFYSAEWVEEKRKEFPSEKMAGQEYPYSPEEAFITSGSPYFNVLALNKMLDKKAEPTEYGRIAPDGHFI